MATIVAICSVQFERIRQFGLLEPRRGRVAQKSRARCAFDDDGGAHATQTHVGCVKYSPELRATQTDE